MAGGLAGLAVPESGARELAWVRRSATRKGPVHRQLHAMFTETALARELYSIQLLQSHPEVYQYLRWIRKQKGHSNFRVRRSALRQ
jgi:hypothetical protein